MKQENLDRAALYGANILFRPRMDDLPEESARRLKAIFPHMALTLSLTRQGLRSQCRCAGVPCNVGTEGPQQGPGLCPPAVLLLTGVIWVKY